MRLIDADLLIKDFENEVKECDFDKLSDNDKLVIETSARALVMFAKRQPTAYDIDKVVEELEETKDMIALDCNDSFWYKNAIDDAIEIVKRGGKNE